MCLKDSGNTTFRRLWELELGRLDEARRSLELIAEQWDHALDRLKSVLENASGARQK